MTGNRARQRKAGLGAARYWRERNWLNLTLARDVKREKRERELSGTVDAPAPAATGLDMPGNPDAPRNPNDPD